MTQKAKMKCPHCGMAFAQDIPRTACVPMVECPSCQVMIRAKDEDCCVICSYSNTTCSLPHRLEKNGENDKEFL